MDEGLESKSESAPGEGAPAARLLEPEGVADARAPGAADPAAPEGVSGAAAERQGGWWVQFFLMPAARARAERQSFGGSAERLEAFRRAAKTADAAEVLLANAPDAEEAACTLLREAMLSAAQALLPDAPPVTAQAWAALESGTSGPALLDELTSAERALVQRAFLGQPADGPALDTKQRLAALRRGVQILLVAGRRQLRPLARVRLARGLRWAAAVLLPVSLAAGIVALGMMAHRRSNLALGSPVTASSHHPKHPRVQGVVDGKRYGIGVHTADDLEPWVRIDLQAVHRIHQVVTYNSDHCCFENAVPLVISISTDGQDYREVARRERPFGVWAADFAPVEARYVKLTTQKKAYLHLSEVEVR